MPQNSLVLYASHRLPVARMGMSCWIRKMPLFEYAELDIFDGEQALLAILRQQPAMAILDVNLPKMNALEIADMLQRNHSTTKIILWGEAKDLKPISEVKMNAFGLSVLTLDDAQAAIETCLTAVRNNENYISSHYYTSVSAEKSEEPSPLQKRFAHAAIRKLTNREKTVMQLIAGGNSTTQIADHLCLSHRTIDGYRLKIARKLNLKGKHSLMLYAHENKDVWQCL